MLINNLRDHRAEFGRVPAPSPGRKRRLWPDPHLQANRGREAVAQAVLLWRDLAACMVKLRL